MNIMVRSLAIITFIITAPVLNVFSQQKLTTAAASEADIAAVRAAYSRINQLPLKREDFKFESSGCVEGGLITYFKDNGTILKIIESGSIGDGSWTTAFYYNAGKPIFCYDKIVGSAAAETKVTTTEYRFYVKNGKPIRCLEGKKTIQPDSKATETIQTAYKLLKAYQTKNFSAALCDE